MSAFRFNIGDLIYWVESSTNYCKEIPCPMCFGKYFVTIILGDGSQERIECGMCSHGLESPSGTATSWEPHSFIRSGVIVGISQRDGFTYEVGYSRVKEEDAYPSEDAAKPRQQLELERVQEQAKKYFEDHFISAKKKQIWSAGYHRNQIKSHQSSIEWHEMRLGKIKLGEPK